MHVRIMRKRTVRARNGLKIRSMMIRNKMQLSEHSLFLSVRKSLFGAVRGVLLLAALVIAPAESLQAVEEVNQSAVIGTGQTMLWRCMQLTAANTYHDTLKTADLSADSVRYTLDLEVLGATPVVENYTICQGDTLLWRCQPVFAAGVYYDSEKYKRFPQVDSVTYTMNLAVSVPTVVPLAETIDEGDTLLWRCQLLYAGGTYYDTVSGGDPLCAETVYALTLTVTPRPVTEDEQEETICAGDTLLWRCQQLYAAGVYRDTVKYTGSKVDSVRYTLTLALKTPTLDEKEDEINQGDTLIWRCMQLYESGTYADTVYDGLCPETIYKLTLTVNPYADPIEVEDNIALCAGDTMLWRCQLLSAAGDYHDTIKYTGSNVDSVHYTMTVAMKTATLDEKEDVIYQGDTLIWRCQQLYESGTYTDTVYDGRCPETIYQLTLTVIPHADPVEVEDEVALCAGDTLLWRCRLIGQAGTYRDTSYFAHTHIDSARYTMTVTMRSLKIKPNDQFVINKGDSVQWRGKWYKNAGEYTDTEAYKTAPYCDSVEYRLRVITYDSIVYYGCGPDTLLWRCNLVTETGHYKETVHYTHSRFTDAHVDSAYYVLQYESYPDAHRDTLTHLMSVVDTPYVWRGEKYYTTGFYRDSIFGQYVECPDTIYNLDLTVESLIVSEVWDTICYGDTLLWGCELHSTSGDYEQIFQYASGNDSARLTLHLTRLDGVVAPVEQVVLPAGDSLQWLDGEWYKEAGEFTYQSHYPEPYGCDSVLHRLRIVLYDSTLFHSCSGDTLLWGCQLLGEDGIYYDTVRQTSIFTGEEVDLVYSVLNFKRYAAPYDSVQDLVISQAVVPYLWREQSLTESGTYYDTVYYANSECADSLFTLNLTVQEIASIELFDTICSGDTLLWQCYLLPDSGTYYDTLHYAESGNDSVHLVMHLTVNKDSVAPLIELTLCNGDSVFWDGEWRKETGDYEYTTHYAPTKYQEEAGLEGCDSVLHRLKLTVRKVENKELTDTICNTTTYRWRDKDWSIPATDVVTMTYELFDTARYIGTTDCDSVRFKMTVTVLRASYQTTDTTVCEQDVINFHWKPYNTDFSGFTETTTMYDTARYVPVGEQTIGCDSVVYQLNLRVLKPLRDTIITDTIICHGADIKWFGTTYNTAGRYEHTGYYAGTGCDSAYFRLQLAIRELPQTVEDNELTVCAGSYVQWRGKWINEPGEHLDTVYYYGTTDCDSLYHKVNLVVLSPTYADTLHATYCQGGSYTWRGKTYSEDGYYNDTLRYDIPESCDSVIYTLDLRALVPLTMPEETQYICNGESYEWFGQTLTQTGTYTHTVKYVSGCDSAYYTLHLEKQAPRMQRKDTLYICGSGEVEWDMNHETYSHAGLYYDTIRTAQGCDSIAGELLVVEQQSHVADPEAATIYDSEQYLWHGEYYTEAGTYNATDYYQSGCDSVYYTLELTVLPVGRVETTVTDTVCPGTDYNGHMINAHTEWTDSVREYTAGVLLDQITNYIIDVYVFEFPEGALESADIACGQAPKITTVVNALDTYIEEEGAFAPNTTFAWFISENNGIWEPLDTTQALNGNDSIVTIRAVMTGECGTIVKEATFTVGRAVYPETFTEYDFLPVIKKFEGAMLMIDVDAICERFGWINCSPLLSTDASYTANGLYPDQVHWFRQVGQVDNLSHPDPTDPKDVNLNTYGYYFRPETEDSYYAIIEHELTIAISDCDAWARTVAISGGSSTVGDLQPNVVSGAQHTTVTVRGVTLCDITVTNVYGNVVLSLQNAAGSFTAPTTPGTYFVRIKDLTSGVLFNRTLLVY